MNIQLLTAIGLLAIAVFFIGRRLYRQLFKKESAGCPDCKVHEGVSSKVKA
jgi:hypothetical protein